MDEERILERERYQIQQIRELDSEELQIEEVEGESSEDDNVNAANDGYGSFATDALMLGVCLTSTDAYVDEDKGTHHKTALSDGRVVVNLPLFYLEGVVLFPEATLQLRVIRPSFIAAIEKALKQTNPPYTIGMVRVCWDNSRLRLASIGTTAERRGDGSLNVATRGRQRFHLRHHWIDTEGAPCGDIQIIPEDLPLRTPRDAVGCLLPLRNLRAGVILQKPTSNISQAIGCFYRDEKDESDTVSEDSFERALSPTEKRLHQSTICSDTDFIDESMTSKDDKFEGVPEIYLGISQRYDFTKPMNSDEGVTENFDLPISGSVTLTRQFGKAIGWKSFSLSHRREVPRAFWPSWVYRMHDSYCLAERAADRWKQVLGTSCMDGFVRKPDILSFQIASKLPIFESTRQELLEIDGTSHRLIREIELLERLDCVRCKNCRTLVGKRSDMFTMLKEGPIGTDVKPHGRVQEILTLHKAKDLALIGTPDSKHGCFPGYAWTMTRCVTCESYMGWFFTATRRKLTPKSFWGIRRSQVVEDDC